MQHRRVNISVQEHHREEGSQPWWSTTHIRWSTCIFRPNSPTALVCTIQHLNNTIMSISNIVCCYIFHLQYIICYLFLCLHNDRFCN
jgi:hypothetical protein